MISKKIKALREHNNYTQDDLALACNVSRSAISNYENDRRQPSHDMVKTIACIFEVTIEELLNDDISIEQILNVPVPSMSFDTNIDDDHVVVGNKRLTGVVQIINAVTTLIVTICLLMVLIPAIKDNRFSNRIDDLRNIKNVTLQLSNDREKSNYEMERTVKDDEKVFYQIIIDVNTMFDDQEIYYYVETISVNVIINESKKLDKISLIDRKDNCLFYDSLFNCVINERCTCLFVFYIENNTSHIGAFIIE